MRSLLVAVALILVGVAGLGFYLGWFHVSTNGTDQKPSATITMDRDTIHADEEKATEKVKGLERTVKEETGNLAGKAKQ